MGEVISMIAQYPFIRNAFIVGVLVSLSASLLGVTLVLKRFSFIGDGLSHVAFGAIAIASVMHLSNNMIFTMPATVMCAVVLLWTNNKTKINGDAAVAMISVSALAVGYLIMNLFSTSSNISGDVCTTLFGSTSILTLSNGEVVFTIVLSIAVLTLFVLLYNKLFAVTFDETYAKASGTNTDLYNLVIAIIIAVIIVIAMELVGSLLISALIIFPALTAMRVFKNFKSVTICSAIIAVVTASTGMIISIAQATPVGATIVVVQIVLFLIIMLVEKIICGRI